MLRRERQDGPSERAIGGPPPGVFDRGLLTFWRDGTPLRRISAVAPDRAAILLDIELKASFGAALLYGVALIPLGSSLIPWIPRGGTSGARLFRIGVGLAIPAIALHAASAIARVIPGPSGYPTATDGIVCGALLAVLSTILAARSGDRLAAALGAILALGGLAWVLSGPEVATPWAGPPSARALSLLVAAGGVVAGAACHAVAALVGRLFAAMGRHEPDVAPRLAGRAHRSAALAALVLGAALAAGFAIEAFAGPSPLPSSAVQGGGFAALLLLVLAAGAGASSPRRRAQATGLTLAATLVLAGSVVLAERGAAPDAVVERLMGGGP